MKDLQRARTLLRCGEFTCVFCDRDRVMTSKQKGIAPIVERVDSEESLQGTAVADKVIGKAAAMLLLYAGVQAVYGEVMSNTAYTLLTENGITAEYGVLTPVIINREGTGPCPMEEAVAPLTEPAQALPALKAVLARLKA